MLFLALIYRWFCKPDFQAVFVPFMRGTVVVYDLEAAIIIADVFDDEG